MTTAQKDVEFVVSQDTIEKNSTNGIFQIPYGVTIIKGQEWCGEARHRVTQIRLPNTVTIIGESSFSDFENIQELELPNSVRIIGPNAFNSCEQLLNVKFGFNVEIIDECAFLGCPIESINLPEGLEEIGDDAFFGCAVANVVIPNSVVTIGNNAFGNCSFLKSATIGKSAKKYFSEFNPIFSSCDNLIELVVRSTVAEYTGAKSLEKVTICDTVKELGKWAFSECPNLEEVAIPDSVTKIGYGAFVKDENLKTIKLSDSITEIGEGAFSGTRLREIIMPKELSKIGRLGGDLHKLRKLDFSKVTKLKVIPEDFLGDCPKIKELVIPIGVTTIEEEIGGENLERLFLPPTVEEIEELNQIDLQIYCFAAELEELEPLTGGVDENNNYHPNHLYVLPRHLDSYIGQRTAEGISEGVLTIEVMPEEYQYYYDN